MNRTLWTLQILLALTFLLQSAQIALNLVLGALAAFVAYGRWKVAPLTTAVPT